MQCQYLDLIIHNSHWSSSLPVRLVFSYFPWWEFWNNKSLWIPVWHVLSHAKRTGKLSNMNSATCCHLYMLRHKCLNENLLVTCQKNVTYKNRKCVRFMIVLLARLQPSNWNVPIFTEPDLRYFYWTFFLRKRLYRDSLISRTHTWDLNLWIPLMYFCKCWILVDKSS